MTQKEIQADMDIINNMSRVEMARMWRFTSSGHRYFDSSLPFYNVFQERFKLLGGFSPEISKEIGWA